MIVFLSGLFEISLPDDHIKKYGKSMAAYL